MDSDSIIQLLIIIVLLILSAFFSSAETALTKVNKVRLRSLADEGNKKAMTALKVLEEYGMMLSSILIGNNIVNITTSALATTFAIRINLAVGIATAIVTVIVLIFCEIIPKNLSSLKAENLALSYAGIINMLMKMLTPVIFVVNLISNVFLKLFGVDVNDRDSMTEEELRTYVDVSTEDGVIEEAEKEMIINVFEFGDSVAKDIMIPWADMVKVDFGCSVEDVLEVFSKCMYTRLPVYDDEKDSIVGLINIKDLVLVDNKADFDLEKIIRAPFFTLEFKKTADLLEDMRKNKESMAFVLNEYGSCVGMITMEDLLEEIVGEIRDEYDEDEENLIQKMEENTYLIEGAMKLDDINNEIGTNLESEDYDSIGGLVIEYLEDRLPEAGESVITKEGIKLMVQSVEHNRIIKVIMTLPSEEDDEEKEAEAKDEH